jgi:hypothetical protein
MLGVRSIREVAEKDEDRERETKNKDQGRGKEIGSSVK